MTDEDDYEHYEDSWDTEVYPDAKFLRDTKARLLRSEGWLVQIETVNTGYIAIYSLYAERKKT